MVGSTILFRLRCACPSTNFLAARVAASKREIVVRGRTGPWALGFGRGAVAALALGRRMSFLNRLETRACHDRQSLMMGGSSCASSWFGYLGLYLIPIKSGCKYGSSCDEYSCRYSSALQGEAGGFLSDSTMHRAWGRLGVVGGPRSKRLRGASEWWFCLRPRARRTGTTEDKLSFSVMRSQTVRCARRRGRKCSR